MSRWRSGESRGLLVAEPMPELIMGSFLYPTGYHVAAWRHPNTPADAGINFAHYRELAELSERGRFDFLFLPDSVAVRGSDLPALSRTAIRYVAQFEPITLLSALAATTRHIGLIATMTTTYFEPYDVARKFASLDHISAGRAGWNVVTSQNVAEAHNFGQAQHMGHSERYARAGEFVDVVRKLWDSWADDAFVRDKRAGLFFDPTGVRWTHHRGPHFAVEGPLNIPRCPQGRPVIVQAGSSDVGREFAVTTAEIVFTAQQDLEQAKAFYADIKQRAARCGRDPNEVKVLVGMFTYCGRTQAEAAAKRELLQSLIDPVVGLSLLQGQLGEIDLSGCDVDQPLPELLGETNAGRSRRELLVDLAGREHMTIRELYRHVAGGRGHFELVGTPQTIADELERWRDERAADGFLIMPPQLPDGLRDFVELVVPVLRERGLMRRDYTGSTLRDHLGLRRPERQEYPHE